MVVPSRLATMVWEVAWEGHRDGASQLRSRGSRGHVSVCVCSGQIAFCITEMICHAPPTTMIHGLGHLCGDISDIPVGHEAYIKRCPGGPRRHPGQPLEGVRGGGDGQKLPRKDGCTQLHRHGHIQLECCQNVPCLGLTIEVRGEPPSEEKGPQLPQPILQHPIDSPRRRRCARRRATKSSTVEQKSSRQSAVSRACGKVDELPGDKAIVAGLD